MFYEKELQFLIKALENCNLQAMVINLEEILDNHIDMGLRKLMGLDNSYTTFQNIFPKTKPYTLYRVTGDFFCKYIFLKLPETVNKVLIIGPYLSQTLPKETIYEIGEKAGLSPKDVKQLEIYYSSIPAFDDNSPIFAMITSFAEIIWNSPKDFSEEDIEWKFTSQENSLKTFDDPVHPQDNSWNMQVVETRYNYENQLITAIARGQTHKAELILSGFSVSSLEMRSTDLLRNFKNYGIIMNTLLRKGAESGGVHPIYLDSISSDFAKQIEQKTQVTGFDEFILEIARAYCHLVKNHSTTQYSSPVQKAIVKIDSDLTADLSLKALAKYNNISAGYFSSLFKAETGQTLIDFVNTRRIDTAKRLLKNTNLQIQTIAQHCGVIDVNYFTKLFKKYTGNTPKSYRDKK